MQQTLYKLLVPAGTGRMNVIDFDYNDCAIRALVFVTNRSYARVHNDLRADKEFHIHRGTPIDIILKYVRDARMRYRPTKFRAGHRVKDVCTHNNRGTYLVHTYGHIFTMIDGVVCGTGAETYSQRIQDIWRVWPGQAIPMRELEFIEEF